MAEKIAEYFGQLKFIVDDKGLKEFVKQLDAVAKKMQGLTKSVSGGNAIKKVAEGMQQIGEQAKVAASSVDKAATKITNATKRATQAQIREQQKLDKALSRGNAANPLTELQNRVKAATAKKASLQASAMKAAEAAELARYEAWFGKAERRDEKLGITSGKDFRRSQAAGQRAVSSVTAEIQAAKHAKERRSRLDSAREMRDNLRAQRRAETASREDERRFQNRVSRTYAPKASRMALYQSDLARTQIAYNAAIAAGGAGASRYAEAIKKLKREIIGLQYEQSRAKRGLMGLRATGIGSALTPMLGMVAAGGMAGLGYGLVSMNDQLVKQQSYQAQFQALYGNEAAGKAGYQEYINYANLRGFRAGQNAQDYLNFMFAGKDKLGIGGTQEIFQSFTELAKVRGVSGERYQRALTALGQMMS